MHLPDDVALQTSNHHGRRLKFMYRLWGDWIEAIGDDHDALFDAMLDAADCFQSSTFDALHGYYRSGLSNLRAALDLVAIGALGNLSPSDPVYARWKQSTARLVFPREQLRRLSGEPASTLLFKQGGWMNGLYDELSAFAHSRPDASDGAMWESNGPVYRPDAFIRVFAGQTATYVACYHMVKVGRPSFTPPRKSEAIFLPPIATPEGERMYRQLFGI